jgi:tetratricopeptide (TPR) repeat protein
MRSGIFGLVCCLIGVHLATAHADGVADEADLQFTVGAEAYSKGEFTAALEHFLASNRLVSNRNVMFNIARAYEQLGRYPDAYRYYIDATRDAPDGKLQKDVATALARIGSRVAARRPRSPSSRRRSSRRSPIRRSSRRCVACAATRSTSTACTATPRCAGSAPPTTSPTACSC